MANLQNRKWLLWLFLVLSIVSFAVALVLLFV